jgi:serine/threonine protein kinase
MRPENCESSLPHTASLTVECYFRGGEVDMDADVVIESVVKALDELHDAGILHRDAEPRNALIVPATGKVWWIGFDCARTLGQWSIPDYWWVQETLRMRQVFKESRSWALEDMGQEKDVNISDSFGGLYSSIDYSGYQVIGTRLGTYKK